MPFDQVMDFSIIQKLGQDEKYSSSKVEYETKVAPKDLQTVRAEGDEILTNTVVIHFFPNSWDPFNTVSKTINGKAVEERYDPNVENVLEEIAQLAGQFGTARIIIEGHTDSSMKGQVPVEAVKDLSLKRANAIKEALLKKYTDLDANRFNVDGVGWDRPVDPLNQTQEPPRRDQGAHGGKGELTWAVCRSRQSSPLWSRPMRSGMTTPIRASFHSLVPDGPAVPTAGGVADRWIRPAPGAARLAGGVHGLGRNAGLPGTLVVCDQGRSRKRESFRRRRGCPARPKHLRAFHSLWFDRALTRNLLTTLRRLALGFGLAAVVGVPLGVLCGCFPRVQAFFLPMTLFGRNIPVAALIPLTFSLFRHRRAAEDHVHLHRLRGLRRLGHDAGRRGSGQPVHRHGLHAGRGHLADDRQGAAAAGVAQRVQLAALDLRSGLRLHHAGRSGEVRRRNRRAWAILINISQRRGPREHVLLILLIIPVVALLIDRLFFTGSG